MVSFDLPPLNEGEDEVKAEEEEEDTMVVDPASNPFAVRPGHTLEWTNVSLAVKTTSRSNQENSESTKTILHSQSGRIARRQLSAIMGHSGAGKTSLLNVLAGKVVTSEKLKMTLDRVPIDPTSLNVKRKIAFVAQRDSLLSTATPREAIRFSAKLRLQAQLSDTVTDALVERILQELRLEHVADNITGGEHFRGLSGGEMRRLSLGIELVVRPSILFCDEVTSGLDSHNATAVMQLLQKVAKCGATVLLTIHQPNSQVFGLIDHVFLLNQGHCMYQGPMDKVPDYFGKRGYAVPAHYNPADWILEVSQVNSMKELTDAGFFSPSQQQDQEDPSKYSMIKTKSDAMLMVENREINADVVAPPSPPPPRASLIRGMSQRISSRRSNSLTRLSIFDTLDAKSRVSVWTEMRLQVTRDIQKLARDGHAMQLRFMIIVVGSAITAFAFQGVARYGSDNGADASSFSSHVGAVFFLIMSCMVAVQVIMLDQVEARPLFVREFETDHYRMISYGLGKIATETIISLVQVLFLVTIVYWAIGLQGRFWYWLLVLYAFTMIMTAVGVALASFTKDARDAKELIPMTMLPQILFCGFFVSNLPNYLHWLQWLWPLTYTYRLMLSEEFSSCMEEEEVLEDADRCVQALLQTLLNANGSFDAIYNEESVAILPQTGQFRGIENILEYVEFFSENEFSNSSLFINGCALAGSMKAQFNGFDPVTRVCDVTFLDVEQGEVNPNVVLDDFRDAPYLEYIQGHRLKFAIDDKHPQNQSTTVLTHNFYLSTALFEEVVIRALNQTKIVLDICTTLRDDCPESYARDGYQDFDDCLRHMESLPKNTKNSRGLVVSDGNSTSCRFVHGSFAKTNPDHCPHVSYFPEEDKNGYIKCSQSYDMAVSDYFSPSDVDLFSKTAVEYGLGRDNQLVYSLTANETRTCRASFEGREAELAASLPEDYLATKACVAYLETQNATGEKNIQYWFTLLSMYVVVRVLGLFLLRNLVTKKTKMA